jgi:HAD ATPase, P-type, family IC
MQKNKSKGMATKSTAEIIRDNVCTVFNLLNVIIAVALALVHAWSNLFFIFIIIVNTLIGIYQEIKAKKLVEKLSLLSMPVAHVLRDGRELEVHPDSVEKGDVLLLESGNVICADSRVLSGSAEINESVLTGESRPVLKRAGDDLLSGSSVISGKCRAEVIHTGEENYAAKLVSEVKKYKSANSELMSSMKKVTRITSFFIVPLGIIAFLEALLVRNMTIADAVISSSAGLLGMLPKGLVLLMSVGLAIGVIRLSKKNVLVQELYSLENLAHCDVLCLDKTGTLTVGHMEVEQVIPLGCDKARAQQLLASYVSASEDNNATFCALKEYCAHAAPQRAFAGVPFSSARKWSSVTLENGEYLVLGAYERLGLKGDMPLQFREQMQQGKRVLFAGITRQKPQADGELCAVEPAAAVIIADPLRKNAKDTIAYFERQGVEVKVISGDDPVTASAVAARAGIKNAQRCIDLSNAAPEDVKNAADKYTVFGRVSPEQKKLLVTALQEKGHSVGMTGDGVNDLLAMKQADCSVAIGQGSDAARQTAQLVLLDSDFAVLKDVISEGRRVVNNITKSAGVFFIKTLYSVFITLWCVIFNLPFPFIPIQITLIDLVIEGFPSFFMSLERNDKPVRSKFLPSAIGAALPNAVAVTVCCIVLTMAGTALGIEQSQIGLVTYLTLGAISVMGVVKASLPFNWLRGGLCAVSALGYVGAVAILPNLFKLPARNPGLFSLLRLESSSVLPLIMSILAGIIITLACELIIAAVRRKKQENG